VAIVPFLDEERHLGCFLESVLGQTRRPDRLVLVDDGSRDGSPAVAAGFAEAHEWVTAVRRPPRPPDRDRLRAAPELKAFLWAVERLAEPFDVIVKMDADLRLGRRHFETVMGALEREPALGMAGTYLQVLDPGGRASVERHPPHHVRGGTRFYRRACFEDVAPIPAMLGWDGADEVRARSRGWETRSLELPGEATIHLRPTGAHDGALRARARWGECAYAVGAHPLGVLAGGLLRMRDRPWVVGGAAYVWGWVGAHARRLPRAPADVRRAKRDEQLARIRAAVRAPGGGRGPRERGHR
jgi:poly-beta-1,6-N-acetyl-D-glucosamine synthase